MTIHSTLCVLRLRGVVRLRCRPAFNAARPQFGRGGKQLNFFITIVNPLVSPLQYTN